MEKHVTNLQISKRLKELGVKQESQYFWVYRPAQKKRGMFKGTEESWKIDTLQPDWHEEMKKSDLFRDRKETIEWMNGFIFVSAFLASELGELLPQNFKDEEWGELTYQVYLSINGWNVDYTDIEGQPFYDTNALTMADAMGKMLIYLLENKLIHQ